jgi:selenocysteine lyase/cysteine desulfurase
MAFDISSENLDREFPVRRQLVYLNHASVGPLPRRVAEAMVAHVENQRDRGAADWRNWYASIEQTRGKAARFLGARADQIAFLPNTSWALNLVALGFPWNPGDNVVIDDMEFPSNAYPWMRLADRGVECRVVRSRDGRLDAGDFARLVDSRTRVIAASWVAFHNGFVLPVEELATLARERGAILVVDAIQGLGAVPLDVARAGIHVLAADSHKWLLGPEGCALFYVSEEARDRVPALGSGWWNAIQEGTYLEYRWKPYASARRYEPGSLPTDHVAGLAAGIDLLSEIGMENVHRRVLALVAALREGLGRRGWRITTPDPSRSGILSAIPPSGDARDVVRKLEARGVIVAPREAAVRFSPHVGNDPGEIEKALAAIDAGV